VPADDGTWWALTDNGYAWRSNSADFQLAMYRLDVRPADSGGPVILETVLLRDPDRHIPWTIVCDPGRGAALPNFSFNVMPSPPPACGGEPARRVLTGFDFDPESFVRAPDGTFWVGEEFGPFLLHVAADGRLLEPPVPVPGVRSPQNPSLAIADRAHAEAPTVAASRGFEGVAISPDGSRLYALLEGPMWDADKKDWEKTADGKEYLRILEFDVAGEKWTGRHWKYVLEDNGLAIGDFNMIDATTGLVIERDNGEGTADKACPAGEKRADCFHDLAKFKRIYKIEMTDANANGPVSKLGYIDLMKIADPNKKARKPLTAGTLAFPFWTIENVDVVDPQHIVVGNDNNLPFSTSREPNKADDNEFVLLRVEEFLKAR